VAALSIANEALKAAIYGRLMTDSRTAASTIDVHCGEGEICLIGLVDTIEQKQIAMTLVSGLIGVRRVKDDLVVRSSPRSSEIVSTSLSQSA